MTSRLIRDGSPPLCLFGRGLARRYVSSLRLMVDARASTRSRWRAQESPGVSVWGCTDMISAQSTDSTNGEFV